MNSIFGTSGSTNEPKKSLFNGGQNPNDPSQWTGSPNFYTPQGNLTDKKSIFGQQKDLQGSNLASSQFGGQTRTPEINDPYYNQSQVKSRFGPQDDTRISTNQVFQNPMFGQQQITGQPLLNPNIKGNEKLSYSVTPNNLQPMGGYQLGDIPMSQSYTPQRPGTLSSTPNQYPQQQYQQGNLQMNPTVQRLAQSNVLIPPEMIQSQLAKQSVTLNVQMNRASVPNIQARESTIVKVDPFMQMSIGGQQAYFQNKRVVVTGASSGVGRAVAMWFLNAGAQVALVGRDLEPLILIGKQFPKQALVIRCDLTKDDQPYDMATTVLKEFGGVDILINAAGILVEGDIKKTYPHDFDYMMDVNIRAVFYLSYLFHQALIQSKGCIINISGQYGSKPFAGLYAYCMSKAGVETLTKHLAFELSHHGVRVNCVSPGMIDSNFLVYRRVERSEIEEIQANAAKFNPLQRIATVDDIGKAIIFLCSPGAGHITGQILHVDGGRTLTSSGWHEWLGSKFHELVIESKESTIDKVRSFFAPKNFVTPTNYKQQIEVKLNSTKWSSTDKNAHATIKNAKYQQGEGRYDPIESVQTVRDIVEKAFHKVVQH